MKRKQVKTISLLIVMSLSLAVLIFPGEEPEDDGGENIFTIPGPRFAIVTTESVDADSDVDAADNIGIANSTYINATTKNGIYQGIKENLSETGVGMMMFNKLSAGDQFVELIDRRNQKGRHFFNTLSDTFRFQSDELVFKENQVAGTDWVTFSEYPIRFIIRLKNGSNYKFQDTNDITTFFSQIDNNTLWGLGVESFNGMMGFYLDLTDVNWGHGQYLYYPRLKSGKLPSFKDPQYALYPHLFVKAGGDWFDTLINNRSFYSGANDPRDHLTFFDSNDEIGLQFQTDIVTIDGFDWNFTQGIKYNTTDRQFHMITDFVSLDRGWQDIGMGYEVTVSPQAVATNFKPDRFILQNTTHTKTVDINTLWRANESIQDPLDVIRIISKNNESFQLDFSDMEQAGFTNSYLELHQQILPNGQTNKTLLMGMFGFGSYTQNTLIEVDPTFSEVQAIDENDFFVENRTLTGEIAMVMSNDEIKSGWNDDEDRRAFLTWDTSITGQVLSISNVNFTLTLGASANLEAGEYLQLALYHNESFTQGFWNETNADLDQLGVFLQDTYYNISKGFRTDQSSGGVHQVNITNMNDLMGNWSEFHNINPTNRTYVSLIIDCGNDCGFNGGDPDDIDFHESTALNPDHRPVLTFDYTLVPVEEYRLNWEHQAQFVPSGGQITVYELTIYANASEDMNVTMWNTTSSSWLTSNVTTITSTLQWYNSSITCGTVGVCGENITWRYADTDVSVDPIQSELSIDFAGIFVFSMDVNITNTTVAVSTLPDASDAAFNENPIIIEVDAGVPFDLQIRATDLTGTPITDDWVFFDNDSSPIGYTQLTASYQTFYFAQSAATTSLNLWLWANVPIGGMAGSHQFTLEVRIVPS